MLCDDRTENQSINAANGVRFSFCLREAFSCQFMSYHTSAMRLERRWLLNYALVSASQALLIAIHLRPEIKLMYLYYSITPTLLKEL